MIRKPMYSLSAGVAYVHTIRVNKHRYKKDSILAKLNYLNSLKNDDGTRVPTSILVSLTKRMPANYFP